MTRLSDENVDLAIKYAKGDEHALDNISEGHRNCILAMFSDVNSSMLREAMTLRLLNYISYPEKHGMDGYCPITNKQKEVKPRWLNEGQKLSSSGNFNDMTHLLLDKKDDCDVICSAFYQDNLMYVVEFPYQLIKPRLKRTVDRAVVGRRVVCGFSWKDYDADDLKVHYLDEALITKTNSLSKNHLKMLVERS